MTREHTDEIWHSTHSEAQCSQLKLSRPNPSDIEQSSDAFVESDPDMDNTDATATPPCSGYQELDLDDVTKLDITNEIIRQAKRAMTLNATSQPGKASSL